MTGRANKSREEEKIAASRKRRQTAMRGIELGGRQTHGGEGMQTKILQWLSPCAPV